VVATPTLPSQKERYIMFTYDTSTNAGKVRLIIMDKNSGDGNYIFEDDEIDAFLSMESNIVLRAAAMALEAIAGDEALVIKRTKILDLSIDGIAVAQALMAYAASLRKQYKDNEGSDFDYAEIADNIFSVRDAALKDRLDD